MMRLDLRPRTRAVQVGAVSSLDSSLADIYRNRLAQAKDRTRVNWP